MKTPNKDRESPIGADNFGWNEFLQYCDTHNIGNHPELWQPWWSIWKRAYSTALKTTTNPQKYTDSIP